MALFYGLISPDRSAVSGESIGKARRIFGQSFDLPMRVRTVPHALYLTTSAADAEAGEEAGGTTLPSVFGTLRLDNRDTVLRALGLPRDSAIPDAGLVARGYRRWRADLAQRLEGEYAFALWDPVAAELYLVRDRFGVRPLFFRATATRFEFASAQELLRHGERPLIDAEHIGGFLAGVPAHPAWTTTPEVARLRPAEQLLWSGGAVRSSTYWRLARQEVPEQGRAEELRRRLTAAVARRTAPDGTTATMLSGGLDSSAVALLASRALQAAGGPPLRSYSMVYPRHPELDERRWIDSALRAGRFEPHFVEVEDADPIAPLAAVQVALGGLALAPGLVKTGRLFAAARADGVRQMLDGHGGDEVVSHGAARLLELALGGRILAALSLVRTQCVATGEDPRQVIATLFKAAPPTLPTRALRRALLRLRASSGPPVASWQRLLTPEFAARSQVRERLAEMTRGAGATLAERVANLHYAMVTAPNIGAGFEALDWLSGGQGIEPRYPFFDRDLVELCLSLPETEKLRRGETRSILRRALADIYPKAIRRRRGKVRYNSELARCMLRFQGARLERLRSGAPELRGIVDLTTLREAIDALTRQREACADETVLMIWKVMALHLLLVENSANFSFRI